MQKYRLFDHTADIGCEIFGRTRKELFANAVAALIDLMLEQNTDRGEGMKTKTIAVAGSDLPDLLVNFLREALYLLNGKKWVIKECRALAVSSRHVVAGIAGEPYNPQKHSIKMEIKAVTYHGLCVDKTKSGWRAMVVFDV